MFIIFPEIFKIEICINFYLNSFKQRVKCSNGLCSFDNQWQHISGPWAELH